MGFFIHRLQYEVHLKNTHTANYSMIQNIFFLHSKIFIIVAGSIDKPPSNSQHFPAFGRWVVFNSQPYNNYCALHLMRLFTFEAEATQTCISTCKITEK